MKFKTIFILALVAGAITTSCKKRDTNNVIADPNAKQHNQDVNNTKSESDNINTDINNALSNIQGFGKQEGVEAISICGATIDSSHQFDPIPYILINFDGTTVCSNPSRIRSGQVKVELIAGTKWTDIGAKVRVTHINYKVKFPSLNNHFVTFNGIKYITNVNGIDWIGIYLGTKTALLRERAYDMTVTFENGQTANWSLARTSEWGLKNFNQAYTTVNGDTVIGGKTIDSWGQTRFGTNFQTEMVRPWKSGTNCGWWKPTEGKYTSTTDNFSVTATFGVDANGNQTNSGCPYGFKLEWNLFNQSKSGSAVLSYF
jgi:hypothetical protein